MKAYLRIYRQQTKKFNTETNQFETVEPYYMRKCGTDNTVRIDNRLSIDNIERVATEIFNKRKKCETDSFDVIVSKSIREWDNGKVIIRKF